MFTRDFLTEAATGLIPKWDLQGWNQLTHTGASEMDELWIYASNTSQNSTYGEVTARVNIGLNSTSPTSNTGSTISMEIFPNEAPTLIVPGLHNMNGLYVVCQQDQSVEMYPSAGYPDYYMANPYIVLYGFRNRIDYD